jgi:serine/threonine protein kinase
LAAQLPEPIQFGKYTLFERIGRGGMAEVYKGRISGPAGFERVFVVKRILPHLSDDATFIKMFVDEAKLSARLAHPNIVQIFELGAVDGEYFISMEYVRGRDLADTMRAIWKTMGPPRPEMVAYIGREACRALSYAHGLTDESGRPLGMIHRDVSPSNIMLSYEGAVKLLDFGIAKALGEAPEITKSGTMKGKYAYMAPEQTEGDDVDHRIDVFSCGIVLHEVLTGRRLFKGQNDVLTIERVRRCEVPPPSLQNPMVPRELDAIILKALARDRNQRWATAADMADALDDVVHAARFQPTHLAQLVYDLFPIEGGAPAPRLPVNSGSHVSSSSIRALRSPSGGPSRTISPARPTATGAALPSLAVQPKRRGKAFALAAAALAVVGLIVWKGAFAEKQSTGSERAAANDPARRFHVFVKSDPPGADIFMNGTGKPIAATPVTIPIDLNGVSSVKLVLKKQGYHDFEQIIVNDTPISISLRAEGDDAPPSPGAALPAGAPTEQEPEPVPAAQEKGGHRHHTSSSSRRVKNSKGGSDTGDDGLEGKPDKPDKSGEIVNPF